jgi:hypothetical protein
MPSNSLQQIRNKIINKVFVVCFCLSGNKQAGAKLWQQQHL